LKPGSRESGSRFFCGRMVGQRRPGVPRKKIKPTIKMNRDRFASRFSSIQSGYSTILFAQRSCSGECRIPVNK
jgi:hypothetical protein